MSLMLLEDHCHANAEGLEWRAKREAAHTAQIQQQNSSQLAAGLPRSAQQVSIPDVPQQACETEGCIATP